MQIFRSEVEVIRKSWFNTPDDDADAANELMCDLFNCIEQNFPELYPIGN